MLENIKGENKLMCEYCENEKRIEENENDNIYFEVYGRFLRVIGKVMNFPMGRQVKINYCPMCGKQLIADTKIKAMKEKYKELE